MIPLLPRNFSSQLIACLGLLLAGGFSPVTSGAELDDYVKAPDPAFAWKQTSNHTTPAGTIHSIELTSQVWQGITWKHELTIYEPAELTYTDTVLLFIVGGEHR